MKGIKDHILPPLVLTVICAAVCGLLVTAHDATYVDNTGVITPKLLSGCESIFGSGEYTMLTEETDGKKLRDAYWFEVPEKYTVDDEHYAKIIFSCKGTDVEVTVNGEPVEIVSVTGRTTYLAKVTDRGVVVVRSR